MKALDLLYRMKKANEDMGNYDAINIYEAIAELEYLNNRSCENCKHWCQEFQSVGICDKGIKEEKHWRETMVFHNFYCNKWEPK